MIRRDEIFPMACLVAFFVVIVWCQMVQGGAR